FVGIVRVPEPGVADACVALIGEPDGSIGPAMLGGGFAGAGFLFGHRIPVRIGREAVLVADPANRRVRALEDHGMRRIALQDVADWHDDAAVEPYLTHVAVAAE